MDIKVQIPTQLNEITLKQYQSYIGIVDQWRSIEDSGADNSDSEMFYLLKTLELFTGINYEDGLKLRITDVKKTVEKLEGLLTLKPDLVKTFKLGDTEFGFIPKLDDMTFGEYVDIDSSLGNWEEMHKCMAVLYRPIKKKVGDLYVIKDYKGDNYHEAMKVMPLDAVLSSLIFFYHLGIELSTGMTKYLESQMKSQGSSQDPTLHKNGVGINRSIHLLKEMLQDMEI